MWNSFIKKKKKDKFSQIIKLLNVKLHYEHKLVKMKELSRLLFNYVF